jgi:hypothetical protein
VAAAVAGCRKPDADPVSAARSVWEAAKAADAKKFRGLYPTDAEIGALFDPVVASRLAQQIATGVAAVTEPRGISIVGVDLVREADVPAGAGLLVGARFARVRVRLRVPTETEDEMALVKLGSRWRALPKEALRFVQ